MIRLDTFGIFWLLFSALKVSCDTAKPMGLVQIYPDLVFVRGRKGEQGERGKQGEQGGEGITHSTFAGEHVGIFPSVDSLWMDAMCQFG